MQGNHDGNARQPESADAANDYGHATDRQAENNFGSHEPRQSTASKLSFGKSRGVKATTNKIVAPTAPVASKVSSSPVTPAQSNVSLPAQPSVDRATREQAIAAMLGKSGFSSNIAPAASESSAVEVRTPVASSMVMEAPPPYGTLPMPLAQIAPQKASFNMSDEDLEKTRALINEISPDALAKSVRQRRYLIYTSTAIVLSGALVYGVGVSMHQIQVVRPAGWLLLFVPICIVMTLKETSKKLAQRDPVMAQRLCNWLALGNPVALSHLASMYADVGNYSKAEKLLVAACKTVPVKNVGLHIVMHANLAAARARSGSISAAQQLFKETLSAAKDLKQVRPVPSSSVVLATALQYGAEIKAQKQEFQSMHDLLTEAFNELAGLKSPPVEVLVAVLSSLGRASTVLGSDTESLLYLEKAKEIADKNDSLSYSQKSEVLANLGWAYSRAGNSEMEEAVLAESLKLATTPSGTKALPAVNSAIASMRKEQRRFDEAEQAYKDAIAACKAQDPKSSHELVNLQSEYAALLRQLGKEGEAAALDLSAVQAKYSLDQTNAAEVVSKKKQQVKPAAVQQQIKKKSRFPIFCILITLFYGSAVVIEGVRVAPFHSWAWFIGFATVVAIKLRAKYGKQTVSDNHGAIIAVLSHLPFARYIVPELATLPQRTVFVFLGCALAIIGGLKIGLPAPGTVPEGLTSFEYFQLGTMELSKESFNVARNSFERAAKSNDLFGHMAERMAKSSLPSIVQPDEAINMNMEALKLKKHRDQAEKIWQDCIAKYPTFETPYVHLAEAYLKDGKTKEILKKADAMVAKALELNPEDHTALISMVKIKRAEGDNEGEKTYLSKMSPVQREIFEKMDKALDGLHKQSGNKEAGDGDEDSAE